MLLRALMWVFIINFVINVASTWSRFHLPFMCLNNVF